MPRLKAWGQGSGAPAHLQIVQGPVGTRRSECSEADVADLVNVESEGLRIAHQTNLPGQESVHAESQGMRVRQWGASAPSSERAPRWHTPKRMQ